MNAMLRSSLARFSARPANGENVQLNPQLISGKACAAGISIDFYQLVTIKQIDVAKCDLSLHVDSTHGSHVESALADRFRSRRSVRSAGAGPMACRLRADSADSRGMLALSIRQPYAELILRGIKTAEFRSRPTRVVGERFYLYAARGPAGGRAARPAGRTNPTGHDPDDATGRRATGKRIISDNLTAALAPAWMADLAAAIRLFGPDGGELPRGVIVGSAVIERVSYHPAPQDAAGVYHWHLSLVGSALRTIHAVPDGLRHRSQIYAITPVIRTSL